jgi:hypothetical protein
MTTSTDIKRVKASELEAGDLIGTTGSNSRATVEAGATDRGATGRSRGDGASVIAKITAGPGGRIQARDAAGKIIRSMAPETVVWRSREVSADAEVKDDEAKIIAAADAAEAKPKAKKATPKAKAAAAKPEFTWPKPPAKLLAEYLKARVTADADGPNRKQPFINEAGVLRVHSTDWMEWLAANDMAPSKGEAAKPLRDAGLAVRSFPLPGEDRAFGFYTGAAPAGTERLPRRAGTRRAAAPRNPFKGLTEPQRSYLVTALVERPDEADETRDELLQLLIAAAPAA